MARGMKVTTITVSGVTITENEVINHAEGGRDVLERYSGIQKRAGVNPRALIAGGRAFLQHMPGPGGAEPVYTTLKRKRTLNQACSMFRDKRNARDSHQRSSYQLSYR